MACPKKILSSLSRDNPESINQTIDHNQGLTVFEATISSSGNQFVIAPGHLQRQWTSKDRNYFHYILKSPGAYNGFPILSARYTVLSDRVKLSDGKNVNIDICYFYNAQRQPEPVYVDG